MNKVLSFKSFLILVSVLFVVMTASVALLFHFCRLAPDQDKYLAYSFALGHEDGEFIWHNIDGAADSLRKADVLFIGNSHIYSGVDMPTLEDYSRKNDLSFFNLGFGFNAGSKFAMTIVRRYNLRPKVVIVNVDSNTFSKPLRDYFFSVIDSSYYSGLARAYVHNFKFIAERVAYLIGLRVRLLFDKNAVDNEPYGFRSARDGGWTWYSHSNWQWSPYRFSKIKPITSGKCEGEVSAEETLAARQFLEEMRQMGTKVIFTSVPYDDACNELNKRLAEKLNVPYIEIGSESLYTYDMYHLDLESSKTFTKRLVDQLDEKLRAAGFDPLAQAPAAPAPAGQN